MKRSMHSIALTMLLFFSLSLDARAAEFLIPVGKIIGLQLRDDTVTIAAYDDALGTAARDAGLRIGDEIVTMDDKPIRSAADVKRALEICEEDVDITVRRSGKLHTLEITPADTHSGKKLGIYIRQGIAGIGTVTWYDPASGKFGALGHGVSTPKGRLLAMTGGNAYHAEVISVVRGKCGEPGQLKGNAEAAAFCAELYRNTPQGVFGITRECWPGQPLPVAAYEEVCTGPATIRSTIQGSNVQEYSVEILKIYPEDRSDNRNFLLRVTDPELLNATGGIVQGMSGSPIIQDGKLVGAVTHVLVNAPDTGYGIFIGNMLEAAG